MSLEKMKRSCIIERKSLRQGKCINSFQTDIIMKKLLIAAGSIQNSEILTSLINMEADVEAESSLSSSDAGRRMESGRYDAMIVNTPLKDGQGLDLCVYVCEKLGYPVVLITSKATAERISLDFRNKGIIVIPRPIDKASYSLMIQCVSASSRMIGRLRDKNRELEEELAERRLVARAKAILMKNMRMTEDQAHRFIEKQSMDLRRPRKEIAQSILKTYYDQ